MNYAVGGGGHGTEVAFELLTQQPRVRIAALQRFFFSILYIQWTGFRERTLLVLWQGISQMQFAIKASAENNKN